MKGRRPDSMYHPRLRRSKLARTLRKAVANVKSKPDTLLTVGWAVVISALFLFALEWFVEAPNRDSSVFIYVAKGILEGEVPYLDRWDHKGPLIYLLNAMGLAVAGMWGLWLLEMAFLIGTVWLVYVVLRQQFGFAATFLPMAVFAGYFLYFSQSGNHTEQYALLFQFLALYLFMRIRNGNTGGGREYYTLFLISIGALAAATFLLRPNLYRPCGLRLAYTGSLYTDATPYSVSCGLPRALHWSFCLLWGYSLSSAGCPNFGTRLFSTTSYIRTPRF